MEHDLDEGFISPIHSKEDINIENIKTVITSSRYTQILILLVVIGTFLRFYHLGYNSLWLDEASTYGISRNTIMGIWQTSVMGEFNPPFFIG